VAKDLPDWVRRSQALYSSCLAGAISEDEYLAGLRNAGLEDAEVRERIIYDAGQMDAFISSELPDNKQVAACCGGATGTGSIRETAEALVGKVWSAKIYARKPEKQGHSPGQTVFHAWCTHIVRGTVVPPGGMRRTETVVSRGEVMTARRRET
jgi:hypothetical protein